MSMHQCEDKNNQLVLADYERYFAQFQKVGQGQVFQFWEQLDSAQRLDLLQQASAVDLFELHELVQTHVLNQGRCSSADFAELRPAAYCAHPKNGGDPSRWQSAWDHGVQALADGRVAAFTVAGGQGTRLGFEGPKGTFPISPLSQKTLFQMFAEKLLRSSQRFSAQIPWYILTSEINHQATVEAFEQAAYFGLSPDSVHFIVQGLVPAVDYSGKILLEAPDKIAKTPDGHGGALRALVRSGALDTLKTMGVDVISYFQVDNPMVSCIDPYFIGFHLLEQSQLSSKMVQKAHAAEKVGVFCEHSGKQMVVEYSDLPPSLQSAQTSEGGLLFQGGSIAIHLFDRDFVEQVAGSGNQLPFHRADKKIPYVNSAGQHIQPTEANGVKFELFVFDALPLAQRTLIIETIRRDEFSPVKNAEGADSPISSRQDQLRQFARWVQAAGVKLPVDSTGLPVFEFEISPCFAVDELDFVARWQSLPQQPNIAAGTILSAALFESIA